MKKSIDIDGNIIEYYLIDPTGNITVLVESFVPVENHAYVAKKLMEAEPSCEQVGFVSIVNITSPDAFFESANTGEKLEAVDIKLRMSAGEFCGNATMSTAALCCKKAGISRSESRRVIVDSSGVEDNIEVDIICENYEDDLFSGRVHMPRPLRIYIGTFDFDGMSFELPVVDFGGISHVIMRNDDESVIRFKDGMSISDEVLKDKAEKAVKIWCNQIGAEGLGLMFVDDKVSYVNRIEMNPLVFVPGCDSCFWENSCGSGTTAVGAYFSYIGEENPIELTIAQPGGDLSIEVINNECFLGGSVKIL